IRDWSVTGVQTCALPISDLHAAVEHVGATRALGVEDRQVLLAREVQQRLDVLDRLPRFAPAVRAVLLQALEDVLGLVAAEVVLRSEERRVGKECVERAEE